MSPRRSSLFSSTKSFSFTAAALLFSYSAHAADGTWTGATNNDWRTTTNWNPTTTPGIITPGSFGSTETATFSTAGSGTLNLGDFINIGTVLFGTSGGNAGAFTLGDSNDTLNLSNAGTVNVTGGVSSNQAVGVAGTIVNLSTTNNSTTSFTNNGRGLLSVAGAVTANQATSGVATLTIGGLSNGSVTGAITNAGTAGAAGLKLVQNGGGGTWTLSGANTFTGGITIGAGSGNGSTLVLDYATNATVVAAANTITFGGGTLYVKGASSGTTTQTLGDLTLASGSGQNRIVVDNYGGSGTTLTLSNYWIRNPGTSMVFDVSQGGTINSNTTSVYNGVVSSNSTTIPYFIKTATVTDFVKVTAGSGSLAPLGATIQLGTSGGSASDHRLLSNTGTHTLTGATTADTLRVDTTTGGGILDLGANDLTLSKRNIIFDGTGNYTINGTTGGLGAAFYSQFSTGTVTINAKVTAEITKLGPGLLVANVSAALTTNLNLFNGVYRAANANSVPAGNINLNSSGIFELTTASGDITKNVGSGSMVVFQGSCGFSAFDSNRVVALGGTGNPTAVTWAQTSGFLGDGGKLILGSAYSGFTLDFRNAIDLNGSQRLVEVNDGTSSTNVDGLLSGVISGTGNSGLNKTGTGTLSLTNVNTYTGATNVLAGRLLVNNTTGSGTGTGPVNVASGATLGGSGTIAGATTIEAGGIHAPGNSPGIEKFTGNLTYADDSIFAWDIDRTADQATRGTGYDAVNVTGTLAGLDGPDGNSTTDAIFRIVIGDIDFSHEFWNTTRTWDDIFTGADGTTAKTDWASIFGGGFQYYKTDGTVLGVPTLEGSFSFVDAGTGLRWTAVPEPTSALAGLLIGAGLLRRRRVA